MSGVSGISGISGVQRPALPKLERCAMPRTLHSPGGVAEAPPSGFTHISAGPRAWPQRPS